MATLNVSALPGDYATIQAAVAAAVSGDTINVAAGTYTEVGQIVINKDLTIVGANQTTTIVKPGADTGTSGDAKGWFFVGAGFTVDFSNLTFDGTGFKVYQAIRFKGSGSVQNVKFANVQYEASGPQYNGAGLSAFGNVDVIGCTFVNMGRVGVVTGDTGSGTFSGNTYTGKGAGNWLDYAFDVEYGYNATITNNTVTNCTGVATVDGSTSSAISVWDDPGTKATISGNTLTNNTAGVAIAVINGGTSDPVLTMGSGNVITGSDVAVDVQRYAPATGSPTLSITGASITGNVDGLAVVAGLDASNISINNSTISGNSGFGIKNSGSGSIDASNNWWGTANAAAIAAMVSGTAVVTPFLPSLTGDYEVDPISRIEGHLGVKLTTNAGTVTEANVHGNLWRGFENFLVGRDVNDAITFTQRICGVCPVPHGQTATFAADAVLGYNQNFQTWVRASDGGKWPGDNGTTAPVATTAGYGIPEKAVHIRNLVLSAEFLMSHITHSYHLAAPSYIQGPNIPPWTPYYDNSFYHPALQATGKGTNKAGTGNNTAQGITGSTLPEDAPNGFSKDVWSAVIKQYVKALRIRRLTFEAGALFAGRMPMTSCYVAGGVTNNKNEDLTAKCGKYRSMMQEIGTFIVTEFVPLFLALGALYPEYDNVNNGGQGYGGGAGNYLAWGGFPQKDGTLALSRGTRTLAGVLGSIDTAGVAANLKEYIGFSRYQGSVTALDAAGKPVVTASEVTNPATEVRTVPERGVPAKYSWLKAPRWNGEPMEVGPMARMFVMGVFQNNQTLLSTASTAVLSTLEPTAKGYDYYAKADSVTGETGLDPAMINADLACALVRAGLATLKTSVDNGATITTVTSANIGGLTAGQIATGYTYANPAGVAIKAAYIMGTVRDWIVGLKAGKSTMDRLRARPIESLYLIQKMIGGFTKNAAGGATPSLNWVGGGWLGALQGMSAGADSYLQLTVPTGTVSGFGAAEAPRGALMHMCTITAGKIVRYQCIVPTTWNASPKDQATGTKRGPMEQAMIGIPYSAQKTTFVGGGGTAAMSAAGGVEALRVAQSFDPCIACAVH